MFSGCSTTEIDAVRESVASSTFSCLKIHRQMRLNWHRFLNGSTRIAIE